MTEAAKQSLFSNPSFAQAFEKALLQLGQIRCVVAHRSPGAIRSGDGESPVERQTAHDCGMRLVQSTQLRKRSAQVEVGDRIVSVGLDRSAKPRDGFLISAEKGFRVARKTFPGMGVRIARAEPQGLADMGLSLLGATDENLAKSDKGVRAGEVSIEFQCAFAFGDALRGAFGQDFDVPQ